MDVVDKLKCSYYFRSTTSISKNLFDNFEMVSSNDDNVDPNSLVYMDSDSNSSEKVKYDVPMMQDIALQEVVKNDQVFRSGAIDNDQADNPMEFTIKKEEECIIDDMEPIDISDDFETSSEIYRFDEESKLPQPCCSSSLITNIDQESTSKSFGFHVVTHDPPSGMPPPPEILDLSDFADADEEQFELIREADSEKGDTCKDTSLVDHPYSQPETRNKDFCESLVEEMLSETGNTNNGSAVLLLSKFTKVLEHFVEDAPTTQLSMYLQSMKTVLSDKTEAGEPANNDQIKFEIEEPTNNAEQAKFKFEVPKSDDLELVGSEDVPILELSNEIPETQSDIIDGGEAEKVNGASAKVNEIEITDCQDQKTQVDQTKQKITEVRQQIKKIQDFAQKLSDQTAELAAQCATNDSDELAEQVQAELLLLMTDSRLEYQSLVSSIDVRFKDENDSLEKIKKNLMKTLADSSEPSTSDSEDLDQSLNLNRKIPKKETNTSAIVSSTKEDPNVSEVETVKLRSRSSSLESESEKEKDIDKAIEKLLDFQSLNYPKPVSSRKISKQKRLTKKKKKKLVSDSESTIGSSSDENHQLSSTVRYYVSNKKQI